MKNCVNCGAILHGNKCEYCGTEYKDEKIRVDFGKNDYMGTMKINGEEIPVYIGHMEGFLCQGLYGRNIDGEIVGERPKMKRKFTVIEI